MKNTSKIWMEWCWATGESHILNSSSPISRFCFLHISQITPSTSSATIAFTCDLDYDCFPLPVFLFHLWHFHIILYPGDKMWIWSCPLLLFSHEVLSNSLQTPWTAAHQASLSFTISQSLLKLMYIESVMPSNHLIICCPLLLLRSIFPSIRSFSMSQPFASGG